MEAHLFFEFLQVAIGNRECLSRELSDNEWQVVFRLLKEHALIGVGFSAVERLHAKGVVCPMQMRMQWYALVVQIERRNEQLNGLCKKVTEQYEHDGLSTCILKGQGNQLNYPENLRMRRMSGDIDIWCLPPKEGLDIAVHTGKDSVEYVKYHGVRAVIEYVKLQHRLCGSNMKPRPIYHHVDAPAIEGVEVEAHFRTGYIHSPLRNRRMQRWFAQHHEGCAANRTSYGFSMPTPSVNVIYQMTHLFSHYFQEGVGLRQILDMYFTLIVWRERVENGYGQQSHGMWSEGLGTPVMSKEEVMAVLRSFGMGKFAGAVMWVLNEVFGGGNENDNENDKCSRRTRRGMDGCPQADDGKECESSEFKRNLNGCPQADSFGERQLENNKNPQMTQMDTDGCPQADEVSEQQLSKIGQQLKEKFVCQQRTRRDTDGGPQADDGKECESSEFKLNLNGCPQKDSFGERQLENNKYPQMTQMDTDGCPQADFVGEQVLITDERLMITDCPWLLCEPNEKEGKKLLEEIMKGGNFGQYDTRDAALKKGGIVKHGVWKLKRVMRLVRSYPEEALWEPVFRVWHLGWRMMNG